MTDVLVIFGCIIAAVTFLPIMLSAPHHVPRHDRSRAADAHALTAPRISYSGNPYRIGAYVYVMEDSGPSDLDWQGTFIGMAQGMAMVRDQETHVVAHVNRDQLYSAQR